MSAPQALETAEKAKIFIPIDVIGEIDDHKKDLGEVGANARTAARLLDKYSEEGDLVKGVKLPNGSTLKIVVWNEKQQELLEKHCLSNIPDNRIICAALAHRAILVSNDLAVRIKARALKLKAKCHQTLDLPNSVEDVYGGITTLEVDSGVIDQFYADGQCELEGEYFPNHYILLQSNSRKGHTAIGRWNKGVLRRISLPKSISGIKPRNLEQTIAFDALLDETLDLVSMIGKSGVGKTILVLAAALELVLERQSYDRIVLMKSPVAVGKDIGFLPGSVMEKILPHYQSYIDNLEVLLGSRKEKPWNIVEDLISIGKIEMVPPALLRGRSFNSAYIIIDEAQNLDHHEIKTIATRLGENSKLVVMGDIKQIDVRLDALSNGLTYLVEAFKDESCAAHITLSKGERSSFAELAAEKL